MENVRIPQQEVILHHHHVFTTWAGKVTCWSPFSIFRSPWQLVSNSDEREAIFDVLENIRSAFKRSTVAETLSFTVHNVQLCQFTRFKTHGLPHDMAVAMVTCAHS